MQASVCVCVYIRGDVHTCMFMWRCVWERERERNWELKAKCWEESGFHQFTNRNWDCAWYEDEIFWIHSALFELQLLGHRISSTHTHTHTCFASLYLGMFKLGASGIPLELTLSLVLEMLNIWLISSWIQGCFISRFGLLSEVEKSLVLPLS